MVVRASGEIAAPEYRGLKLSADAYAALPDDGFRYELVDGVVVLSPSPTPRHQRVLTRILHQLLNHLARNPVGEVLPEVDVRLADDLVYRPDLVFFAAGRKLDASRMIAEPPDLVVEVVSPDSRRYDRETKRADYERCGVREYWVVDPLANEFVFLRGKDGRFEVAEPTEDRYASVAIDGFKLDLNDVRSAFSDS